MGQSEQSEKSPGPRPLNKQELARKLDKFRTDIAGKMPSDKLRKRGRRSIDRWLRGFQAIQSQHYLVYTNGPRTTSKKFAKSLEKLYGFIKARFPFEDLNHHLECYIFKSKAEYVDFCTKIAGWSKTQAEGTAGHAMAHYYATYYQSPTADTVMHEAAHQIVSACLKVPGVGSWFQEGFAVYIEKKIGNSKVSATIKSDLRRGNFYELEDLVEISSLISDVHSRRNYDQAGTVLDFLIHTKREPLAGRFPKLLAAARRNYGRGSAVTERLFQKVYGLSIAEVGAHWKAHFGAPDASAARR